MIYAPSAHLFTGCYEVLLDTWDQVHHALQSGDLRKDALCVAKQPPGAALTPVQVANPVTAPEPPKTPWPPPTMDARAEVAQRDAEAQAPDRVLVENITRARQLIMRCRLALNLRDLCPVGPIDQQVADVCDLLVERSQTVTQLKAENEVLKQRLADAERHAQTIAATAVQ